MNSFKVMMTKSRVIICFLCFALSTTLSAQVSPYKINGWKEAGLLGGGVGLLTYTRLTFKNKVPKLTLKEIEKLNRE